MRSKLVRSLLACGSALLLSAAAQAASVPGTTFEAVSIPYPSDGDITAYVSGPDDAPLILVLQGSGCGSVFMPSGDAYQPVATQDIVTQMAGERARIAVVEKAHVALGEQGSGEMCSDDFARAHTLEGWTTRLGAALDRLGGGRPVALIGLSEGAVVAARLAAMRPDIASVAFISADGCNLIDDMLATAVRQALQEQSDDPQQTLDLAMESAQREIEQAFDSDTAAEVPMWGQHVGYWRTFGRACAAEDLARSDAEVLLAYGTADTNIVADGVERIVVERLAAGREIETIRIAGGDHALTAADDADPYANLVSVLQRAVEKALGAIEPPVDIA